jgi:chromosome segregation ATPase
MAFRTALLVCLVALATPAQVSSSVAANPMRRVVTMLQNIVKKCEADVDSAKDLHEKFLCQCKTETASLSAAIETAETNGADAAAAAKEGAAQKAQLESDLAQHKADRTGAKEAMASATSIREKEAGTFAAYKAEAEANIEAIRKAVAAIEKGAAGSFLQTSSAEALRNLVQNSKSMDDSARSALTSFLADGEESDASGEILGVLKQLGDEMSADLADTTSTENASIKSYDDLIAAKKKEVETLNASIEDKLTRVGELGVKLAELGGAGGDAADALEDNKKFLADLTAKCKTAQADYDAASKERADELAALGDTIKMLNDDDALELFKKTLPSAASSFLQVQVRESELRSQARAILRASGSTRFDFIGLALHGQKMGMGKVVTMIDEMVAQLKQEQKDDDKKKEYCEKELDTSDDKKKALEQDVSDNEKAMADAEESLADLAQEIRDVKTSIRQLDQSVAEATQQRKEENTAFQRLMASNTAAKELIGMAKNRLNKFYNPKLYKAPPKRELTEAERIAVNNGETLAPTPAPGGIAGTGITVLAQKKSEESGGVMALMDLLVADLDKEMTIAETNEKDAQADYEKASSDASKKRADDSKTLEDKEGALADTEAAHQGHKDDHTSNSKELQETNKYIAGLHGECDWLLQNFEQRVEARAGEVDALKKAKAVLSGADFSLLQTSARHLRGHM